MSLFTLIKITRTRHPLGNKQVKPGRPGAVNVREESANWTRVAGVPYRMSQGDADFHSLRMTSNVMLGQPVSRSASGRCSCGACQRSSVREEQRGSLASFATGIV